MTLLIQYLLAALTFHTSAHLHLLRTEPAANDTVATAPAAIKFWFSEKPEVAVTTVKLTTAAGTSVQLAPLAVDTGAKPALVAAIKGSVAKGAYTVTWKSTAMDGHPASGQFNFVVSH